MAKAKKEKTEKQGVDITSADDAFALMRKHCDAILGKGTVITLSEDHTSSVSEWIHSGSYILDLLISNGRGLPFGKMVTISGKKSSGKSTLAGHIVAEAQRIGAIAVYLDAEVAFQKERAEVLGINNNTLMFSQPTSLEHTFETIEAIIEVAAATKSLVVIVWDSVAATPTRKEIEGEVGEGGQFGEHSKILSQGFRRIASKIASNRVLLFVVNQIKTNTSGYGDEVTYIGKNPLDFHSHVMIEIKQIGKVKDGDEFIGIDSLVKISKNRVGNPFKEATLRFLFAKGIDKPWEALEIGKSHGRVRLAGSWNEILRSCSTCAGVGKVEGKRCETCEGAGRVYDDNYKKFYSRDIDEMLVTYPGLEQYFLKGTVA